MQQNNSFKLQYKQTPEGVGNDTIFRHPFLFRYRKMLVTWWNANENCEAILGGQNAGFALLSLHI
ncbi:hypothetical protein DXA20_07840 [Roseburia sp. AM59-24XD]|nr:hypothetical protein DXA20_07840 [Roseburia sp. AM59-24XD]